ncbi:hypothetical protein PHET_07476 [Paragonimus heterotremus]|uniref:SCP domain-containing protein n=1 Tax=Paragonimus heterotremus TaxID=100268 RepID=A0A8J4WTD2_9TREM|nr:hypothetical protein PHET_07476 [Paragonimus heterotremus]
MIQYILILCTVGMSKCELTQTERDKILCYHNTLRQITSNCMSSVGRKSNILTWNKTLEHFAHIYSRPTHPDYATMPELSDFCEQTNIMQISYEVDHHEQ